MRDRKLLASFVLFGCQQVIRTSWSWGTGRSQSVLKGTGAGMANLVCNRWHQDVIDAIRIEISGLQYSAKCAREIWATKNVYARGCFGVEV